MKKQYFRLIILTVCMFIIIIILPIYQNKNKGKYNEQNQLNIHTDNSMSDDSEQIDSSERVEIDYYVGEVIPQDTENNQFYNENSGEENITEDITEEDVEEEVFSSKEKEQMDKEYNDSDLVKVSDFSDEIIIELKYATEDNFTNSIIYDFTEAYVRHGTMKKLIDVSDKLLEYGYKLKLWDAYRPPYAQFVLWDVTPNKKYVANPNKGFSSHSRGNTIDVTIVSADGSNVAMPTGFDDFSPKADRDYNDCSEEEKKNALILETIMIENGFHGYYAEWWHFTDDILYDVLTDQEFTKIRSNEQ